MESFGGRFCIMLASWFTIMVQGFCSQAQSPTLNVRNFGARGDVVELLANTVINSPVITIQSTNRFSGSDVGKLILLFGAGPGTTSTNYQDLVATIAQVSNGTNVVMSLAAGVTANNLPGICGTQNATAFQNCVDACAATNTTVLIPAGTYLLVPPAQLTNFVMQNGGWPVGAAVTVRKGGIRFLGAGMDQTVLLGCGAWKLQGAYAHRGWLFNCVGPVTNNYPLIFDGLTMNGGVPNGNTAYHGFPASVVDGSGWDETHDAVVDSGSAPLHAVKIFQNCGFVHWRGEEVKSVMSGWDGYILMTNCLFADGNASGFNFNFTHTINHCVFSNIFQVLEFYEGYCSNTCYFENTLVTNITGNAIAINGALTNHVQPSYNILSNTFFLAGGFGILTTPAQNLYVIGNQFLCTNNASAIGFGCAGYQGTAINSNLVVQGNSFIEAYYAVVVMGSGQNLTANALICSNLAVGVHNFTTGYGWSTNVAVIGNIGPSTGPLMSSQLQGQWFLDDISNNLMPWQESDGTGKTNTISYAYGMRHTTFTVVTNSSFVLDDTRPQQIPAGACLVIAHKGNYPAPLYFSAVNPEAGSTVLSNGCNVICQWKNGLWQIVTQTGPLMPPDDVHVIAP